MTAASATHLDRRSHAYVREVLRVVEEAAPVLEAFLVGSGAAGGFEPRTSDLDVVAVVDAPLGPGRAALVRRVLEIPCPARDLELVLYAAGSQPPDFELNLSRGEERPEEDGFWFVLDASIAEETAVPLLGDRPWSDFFDPVSPARVRRALRDSIAWSARHPDSEFARLNAVRARHYLDHGEWLSKEQARR